MTINDLIFGKPTKTIDALKEFRPMEQIIAAPLRANFFGNGRQPQCKSDPAFPYGKPVDISEGQRSCVIGLTHPTPCCGYWLVLCDVCKMSVALTSAGRPDDPSTVRIPCRLAAAL